MSLPNPEQDSARLSRLLLEYVYALIGSPLLVLYALTTAKPDIRLDSVRWLDYAQAMRITGLGGISYLLGRFPEFRSLFYYRVKHSSIALLPLILLFRMLYRGAPALYIRADKIGPGLLIQHGFSTIIEAVTIGENCLINHQVTVGYGRGGKPTIGNNVQIRAGAKVIGGIKISDNVTIGANAVVVKDVPPNCVVVGIPAYIVRHEGERVHQELT